MELHVCDENDITLPNWIGATSLTLEEIGAVAVLGCVQSGVSFKELDVRFQSPEMAAALASLKEKGVFKPTMQEVGDGRVVLQLNVDLDVVAPK